MLGAGGCDGVSTSLALSKNSRSCIERACKIHEAGKLQAGANLINCTVGSLPERVPSIDVSSFTINGMIFLTQISKTFVILAVVTDS